MIVNVEFFDDEPIENVMTGLNFQIDKMLFFGYQDVMEKRRSVTEHFLKKYCNVREVVFCELPDSSLNGIRKKMYDTIVREKEKGNQVFFDLTGGENLILVAFGMLAEVFQAPMHMFDIEEQRFFELNPQKDLLSISQTAKKRKVNLNIDMFIEMQGGLVNYNLQKDVKNAEDPQFEETIEKLWRISKKYGEKWNLFADFIRRCCAPDEALKVNISGKEMLAALRKTGRFRSVKEANRILKDLASANVLLEFSLDKDHLSFRYQNDKMKELLWDAGSILEMHTFLQEREGADDCRVGVHLDWDGVIYNHTGRDTLNEVDVLSLHGVIPTFISCKNGSVNQMALYELETVAKKFGGKYARKVIAAPQGLNETHSLRAKEMNIQIRQ